MGNGETVGPQQGIPGDQGDPGGEVTLEQVLKECMDSQGYVIFAAVLSSKRDDKGFNLIDYRYRRYHFSFEDTKQALAAFQHQYRKDLESM